MVDQLLLNADGIAKLTCTCSLDWPAARRHALRRVLERFLSSAAEELAAERDARKAEKQAKKALAFGPARWLTSCF